ncbi:MAG: nitroreductase [Clostridiales bacterium]|jgi:nitroreductase|nr:nitroreductase [Clostridiales bacterium]
MENQIDFLALASQRYSVRSFLPQPIEKEALNRILQAGHLAPTACNLQPQRILVVDSPESVAKLRKCTKCHFDAPAALLVCYEKEKCWKRRYDGASSGVIDASIVATHMMLEAAALGVGTTWVMYFDPQAVREEFQIPETIEPVALLVMGYPSKEAKPYPGHSEFRSLEEVVVYHQF